ncbi:uncharacterized protein LOC110659049 [Hevea brasiliensis]|uniref:uncharacterized protein LOC110659049 n=1 Tax=Hevea brasiliensis TaxID=3981 RepID=UPI0025DFB81E|nr:uncharacterized protein LOC110659049 [Hevea brasiliensis]
MWKQKIGEQVKWLKKLNPDTSGKRDQSKFCRFHEDHGHITDECRKLKDEIKRLIRDNQLRRFTRESQDERRTSTSRSKEVTAKKDESLIRVISVIAGRPNIGNIGNKRPAEPSNTRGQKIFSVDKNELSKEIITISPNDHEMNRYTVLWVLIDTGSSVNLLTKEILEKLGHKSKNLAKVMLVNLSEKTVLILGTINLAVVLGDEGYKQEIYTKFAIVDIPLSYNIILG